MFESAQQIQSERSGVYTKNGLRLVQALFARLHEAQLRYCHWKSNEHVQAAVEGLTDLDVLVDRRQATELQCILADIGFKRFTASPSQAYPAIEDYLGVDSDTGRLVHLHLHWQLTVGERHLKGYRLPWETRLLATRRFDPEHGLYVADPAVELALLLVRAALKHRARDRLRRFSGGKAGRDVSDFQREFAWLHARATPWALMQTARSFLGSAVEEPLRRLLEEPDSRQRLLAFRAAARPALAGHRSYGRFLGRVRAWFREGHWVADVVNRRYLHSATPLRRLSPRGGTVIALLGCDGSGKSTLARTLIAWLGVKLDVLPVYLGSGDGSSAVYRRPLRAAYRLLQPLLTQPPEGSKGSAHSVSTSRALKAQLRSAARVPWALVLSCEKRGKLRRVIRARNRGMIVVCDRFVQADVPGFNDGPLLDHWREHRWSLCRSIARWEARPYLDARLDPPDLVIKLSVSPAVALARRPEMSLPEVLRRISAVNKIRFPIETRVVDLGADASLDHVALAAKRIVWDEI